MSRRTRGNVRLDAAGPSLCSSTAVCVCRAFPPGGCRRIRLVVPSFVVFVVVLPSARSARTEREKKCCQRNDENPCWAPKRSLQKSQMQSNGLSGLISDAGGALDIFANADPRVHEQRRCRLGKNGCGNFGWSLSLLLGTNVFGFDGWVEGWMQMRSHKNGVPLIPPSLISNQ